MKLKRWYIHGGFVICLVCFLYGILFQFRTLSTLSTTTTPRAPSVAMEFRRRRVKNLNISTPILILSLPKSGTTSLARYFICGGIPSAHTYRFHDGSWLRLGDCLRDNFEHNLPLLQGCGPYKVWSDLGVVMGTCFYPSLEALERIPRDYPHATILVSYRAHWFESVQKWSTTTDLLQRWINRCSLFPNTTETKEWNAFYENHRRRIRSMVEENPSLNLLEIDLDDKEIGHKLHSFTGISAECWGDCLPETGECVY